VALSQLFPGFTRRFIQTDDAVATACLVGGTGSPILLLHGHPQTSAMWHRVAPVLARQHSVVMADLRGYGDSGKPQGLPDHSNYTKRRMAHDQLRLMSELGFESFAVLAHDRGARVAHRLAMDAPTRVQRLVMLDVAPTLAMYEGTGEAFARGYWHWFAYIQPGESPERFIRDNPSYIDEFMGARSAGLAPFDTVALSEYRRCVALPGAAHGICEDYRATAGLDLAMDRGDREAGIKLQPPAMVLWGEQGVVHQCFDPLLEWQRVASDVVGECMPCGHYIAEEAPEALLERIAPFFA